jgi:hypothetical protein
MGPDTKGIDEMGMTMGGKMFDKLLIYQDAWLGQALHVMGDFNVDTSIVDDVKKVILINDGLWKRGDGDSHALFASHGGAEVDVFAVECCKPHTWS